MVTADVADRVRYSQVVYDLGEIYADFLDFDGQREKIELPFNERRLSQMQMLAETAFMTSVPGTRRGFINSLRLFIPRVLPTELEVGDIVLQEGMILALLKESGDDGLACRVLLSYLPPRRRDGEL